MTSISVNPRLLWPELFKLPLEIIIGGVCDLSQLQCFELNRSFARSAGPDHRDINLQHGVGWFILQRGRRARRHLHCPSRPGVVQYSCDFGGRGKRRQQQSAIHQIVCGKLVPVQIFDLAQIE